MLAQKNLRKHNLFLLCVYITGKLAEIMPESYQYLNKYSPVSTVVPRYNNDYDPSYSVNPYARGSIFGPNVSHVYFYQGILRCLRNKEQRF